MQTPRHDRQENYDFPQTNTQPGAEGASSASASASGAAAPASAERRAPLSRRAFLGAAGTAAAVGSAGAVLAGCGKDGGIPMPNADGPQDTGDGQELPLVDAIVDFDGEYQAGIATAVQAHLNMVAFDIKEGLGLKEMKNLLRLWTEDARRLTQGKNPLGSLEPEMAQVPANLTITCGVGERFFDVIGKADQRPEWLHDIPEFSLDQLEDRWSHGDIVLQICCDDPTMLAFSTRHMIRSGHNFLDTRWVQQGFLNADGALERGRTPRNLFGQLDGTVNPRTPEERMEQVWIEDGPQWSHKGTCMVVRRIAMNLDTWEILDRESRELSMGRTLDTGAPLTGEHEFDDPDFEATDKYGLPIIDPASHVARSHPPKDKPHERLQRRAYNYDLPPEPGSNLMSNAGLVFICFQKNPDRQFTPIQTRLNEQDRLNQWITHIGSSVFFILPGTGGEDGYWGQGLLEA